jgi:predicted PurR-regulated permease PerM
MDNEKKGSESKGLDLFKYFSKGLAAFLVIAASIVFFFLIFKLDSIAAFFGNLLYILQPIIFGFVFAYLLNPLMVFLERWLKKLFLKISFIKKESTVNKLSRGIGIFGAIMIMLLVIFFIGYLVLPELYNSIVGMIKDAPAQIAAFQKWFVNFSRGNAELEAIVTNVSNYITDWLQTDLLDLANRWIGPLAQGLISAVNTTVNVIIGVIVSVYVLSGKEIFAAHAKKIICAVFGKKHIGQVVVDTARHSHKVFSGFIIGKLVDSLIVGILCFIGMCIFRMPYALLVSVVIGVTNIIPFFGPYIGAIPSILLIMLVDPWEGLYFIVFILVLQQIDGNIIGPKIVGNSIGLSAFWVVVAILLGGGLFGLPGLLIGVPVFAVLYDIVKTAVEYRLKKKHMPVSTENYKKDLPVDRSIDSEESEAAE